MSEDDDPFADLGDDDDGDGDLGDDDDGDGDDPFADLEDETGDDAAGETDADTGSDPAEAFAEVEGDDGTDDPLAGADDETDPFADVEGVESEEVGLGVRDQADTGGAHEETDPFASLESDEPAAEFGPDENDLFTEVEVDDVDEESVWSDLAGDEPQTAPETGVDVDLEEEPTVDAGGLPEESDSSPTQTETVVPKRTYCEKCEYFSEPPEVGCSYHGAEILELVDTEQFRVRNCPIVARRQSGEVAEFTGTTETDGGEEP